MASRRDSAHNRARNDEIIRRRRSGQAPCAIMAAMGLSRGVVLGVLFRAGLTDPLGPTAAPLDAAYVQIILRSAQKLGVAEAAKAWGTSRSTIYSHMKRAAQ